MDTTTHGLPFPEAADALQDYPAVAQTLAELLDDLLFPLYDSTEAGVSFPAANIVTPALDQTYRDLVIDILARTNSATATVDGVAMQFNGDNGANYDSQQTQSAGASGLNPSGQLAGTSQNGAFANGGASLAGAFSWCRMTIPDYASTTRRKVMHSVAYGTSADTAAGRLLLQTGGSWRSLAAISTIAFVPLAGSLVAGTRIRVSGRK